MSAPILKLPIQSVHFDVSGDAVRTLIDYNHEWMIPNLIRNGGFEVWADTDLSVWAESNIAKVTSGMYDGAACIKGDTAPARVDTEHFPINPSRSYVLSFWHKSSSAGNGVSYTIYQYNSADSLIATGVQIFIPTTTTWTQETVTLSTWNASTAYVRIRFSLGVSPDGYLDDVMLVPDFNRTDLFSLFTEPTQDSEETFTFPGEPLTGSDFNGQDDPTQTIESISGYLRIEQDRYPRRAFSVKLRLFSEESANQLRRFYAKSCGLTWTYVDHKGVSRTVKWSSPPLISGIGVNTDIYTVTLNLIESTVTNGA